VSYTHFKKQGKEKRDVSSKTNLAFFNAYIELDKICADRLGVKQNGVSTYINKLVDMRFAPGRSDILPKLIRYRNCRNKIAHETGAMMEGGEISKYDVRWIRRFTRTVAMHADPVSRYERKALRYNIWRKFCAAIIGAIIAVVGVGVYYLLDYLQVFG
jgi:hypothetical protein